MKPRHTDYQVAPYPKYRLVMAAAYRSVQHIPMFHGLLEVNVTRPRRILREHRANTGESLSFTAFLAACVAKGVGEHKAMQAYRQGGKRLVLFDDVDISLIIEHDLAGEKYIIPYIVRAANRKTVLEIHREIRAVQGSDVEGLLKRLWPMLLPSMLYRPVLQAFVWVANRRPRLWKETMGTVGISSVGMFGNGAGWGIPNPTPTALTVTVGGICERHEVADGDTTIQEYLSLTISVDHDRVDGAPAARFTQRLQELIENGYGLDAIAASATPEPVGAEAASQQATETGRSMPA